MTLTDNGTVSFAAGDYVSFNNNNNYSGTQITVGSTGVLQANNTSITSLVGSNTNGGNFAQMVVNAGGKLTVQGGTLQIGAVTLNTSTTDTITSVIFSGVLTVNSGDTLSIHGDDFSNVGNQGIIAVGDPTATIDMTVTSGVLQTLPRSRRRSSTISTTPRIGRR